MSVTEQEQTIQMPAAAAVSREASYETCEHCHAPVEAAQRYCVVCGARRRHVHDPAARYHSEASSRSRGQRAPQGARRPARRGSGLGLALLLAAIPLAVAAGVLIGRPGSGIDNKLLAALRAQKPTVVNVGGGGTSTAAASSTPTPATASAVARLTSNFGLPQGYAVELQTLPGAGTTPATVAAAKRRARARGATAVGLISQADFRITPAPPAGDYVIYSGQYGSSAAATAALAKLRNAFPSAAVIAVRSLSSAGADAGKVLATSNYGSAHQVSGFKPSASALAAGAKVVNQESKQANAPYVKSQQGLPDAISVP
jgi:hypothetical protein